MRSRASASLVALLVFPGAAVVTACSGSGPSTTASAAHHEAAAPNPTQPLTAPAASTASAPSAPAASTPSPAPPKKRVAGRATRAKPSPGAAAPPSLPLAGKVVGIDPGHNGRNYTDPGFLNQIIWNGRAQEGCDTTGTQTDGGYTEAKFNFNVATYLAADLRAEGAKVVLTRKTNTGIGPCVNTRAQIINHAHSNVAIDIHADAGPPDGRGFTIIEPIADGPNNGVIGASKTFAQILFARYCAVTGMPVSTYDGVGGFIARKDLAGLNLTTVPKVLIETGNMKNATDAALLVRASFQRRAANAFAQAITQYLKRVN